MQKAIHTYLDLDVVNNNLTSDVIAPMLKFEEIRNTPFLEGDSSEYFCSIMRFSIQTGNSLPIFIPRIEVGQADVNKTVYQLTLRCLGGTDTTTFYESTVPLYHKTSDATVSTPLQPLTKQDMSSNYYFYCNIQDIIDVFNTACTSAFVALNKLLPKSAADPAKPDVLTTILDSTYCPFFEFDYDTCKLVLNVDQNYLTSSKMAGEVYFNTRFYELLSTLHCDRISRTGFKNYRLHPSTINTRTVKDATGTYTMCQTIQEMSTLAIWNPIASVVFCTGMLPVVSTNTSPPLTYDDTSNYNLTSSGNNSNLSNIISDFEIPVSESNQYRPIIVYNPSAEYRLIDMNSQLNLNKIDISVFWKTHYGEFIPLRLQPGCAAHIKLLFRHKTFYLGY